MNELSLLSQISLFALLFLMGMISLIVFVLQIGVIQGKDIKNPDGTVDNWHEQKIFYGIAVADLVFACPLTIAGIVRVFIQPQWGFYLLGMSSFWFVWANIMTTATSIRFEKPKISIGWFIAFPFGTIVGIGYLIWIFCHFNIIYTL